MDKIRGVIRAYKLPETIDADNLQELADYVGDTKVGYSVIILTRNLDKKGMPNYSIFTSTNLKIRQGVLRVAGYICKSTIRCLGGADET